MTRAPCTASRHGQLRPRQLVSCPSLASGPSGVRSGLLKPAGLYFTSKFVSGPTTTPAHIHGPCSFLRTMLESIDRATFMRFRLPGDAFWWSAAMASSSTSLAGRFFWCVAFVAADLVAVVGAATPVAPHAAAAPAVIWEGFERHSYPARSRSLRTMTSAPRLFRTVL